MIEVAVFFVMISTAIGQFVHDWCRRESTRIGWHVSHSQVKALRMLYNRPYSTLGSVAEYLGIKSPTASTIISRLNELEMIEKARDPANKQRVQLSLSKSGKEFVENYDRDLLSEVGGRMHGLKSADLKELLSATRSFTKSLIDSEEEYQEPKLSVSSSRMAGVMACSQTLSDTLSANAYRYISEVLSGSKVSNLQLRILVYLDRHPGSMMTDLAEHVGVRMPTVSSAVRVLVKHGMVRSERVRGKGQRRKISPTGLGSKVIIGYKLELVNSIHRAAECGLSEKETASTLRARELMIESFGDNQRFGEEVETFRTMTQTLSVPA